MIERRAFFKKMAAIMVAVALAPEICFRIKLDLPSAPKSDLMEYFELYYDLMRVRRAMHCARRAMHLGDDAHE